MSGDEVIDELDIERISCPLPLSRYDRVQLAHGGGGRLMNELIEEFLRPAFAPNGTSDIGLQNTHDGAVLDMTALGLAGRKGEGDIVDGDMRRLAFSTDSYVVHPLFFPGGSIGDLAVHGTANDLAMCGARPLYLTLGLILEEGLPMETLQKVVEATAQAAIEAKVTIITGDTKVVDKGKGDGVYINTAGVGVVEHGQTIHPSAVRPGDVVILSGDIGSHGVAIISVREGLKFETSIESDTAPLWPQVEAMLNTGKPIHCLRDLTRGGLTSALNEIAATARLGIEIEEMAIPIKEEVRGACELLGFDPLYVANEGCFAAFVPAAAADTLLEALRTISGGEAACAIGRVVTEHPQQVIQHSKIGGSRIVDMLSGEQLPRIC